MRERTIPILSLIQFGPRLVGPCIQHDANVQTGQGGYSSALPALRSPGLGCSYWLFLPHCCEPWVVLQHPFQLLELLDCLHLVPGQPLFENLGAEHRLALVTLKLALILFDVVATPLHLSTPFAQGVLLLFQAPLDDLCPVCETLSEVLSALLRNKLRLQGIQLHSTSLFIDEVDEVGRQDVYLRGLFLLLLFFL